MSEIFLKEDIASLLDNRFIVVIGDSIQRGVYKDLVLLLQKNKYLTDSQLRAKGEMSFSGDKLVEGGQLGEMTNGVKYREVRQYQTDYHLIRFYFVTRCYNSYVESILTDLSDDPLPDVVLMNSCLWDISRYGNSAVAQYKVNIKLLFKRFKDMLPPSCLIVWNSTMPISKKARGGFLIPAIEFMNSTLRLDILEANFFVHKLAIAYGFNVLDLHYFLRHQLQRRAGDGVHWDMTAHRRITNLILTHVAQSWGVKPPQNTRELLFQNNNSGLAKAFDDIQSRGLMSKENLNPGKHFLSPLNFTFCHNEGNNFSTQTGRRVQTYSQAEKQEWEQEAERQESFVRQYGGPIRHSNYNTGADFHPQGQFEQLVANQYQHLSNQGQYFVPNYVQAVPNQSLSNQGQFFMPNYNQAVPHQSQFTLRNQNQDMQGLDQFIPENVNVRQLTSNRDQFKWEPYDQRNFEPRGHCRLYSDRIDPYTSRERKRVWRGREGGRNGGGYL